MLTLKIAIIGKTTSDLEEALREVKRLVGEEFLSGHNSNDTGSFTFDVSGDEDE